MAPGAGRLALRRPGVAAAVVAALRHRRCLGWRSGEQRGACPGVLPLYRLDEPGVRKLLPIGAGTTDHLDALLEPGVAPGPLLQAALDHARADEVDVCDLIEVPPGSALRERRAGRLARRVVGGPALPGAGAAGDGVRPGGRGAGEHAAQAAHEPQPCGPRRRVHD